MSEWQPIETAPFDESVFVFCRIYGRFIAYKERIRGTDFGQWCNWKGEKGLLPPTHWMPLPEPPNSAIGLQSDKPVDFDLIGNPIYQNDLIAKTGGEGGI